MTKEQMGMGEGFDAKRISPPSIETPPPASGGGEGGGRERKRYSLRLTLVEESKLGQQNVRPAAEAELLTVELAESEVWGFVQEAAGWAQSGLKSRHAIEGQPPRD